MPTPDASWAPAAVAGFVQRAESLDLLRLLVATGVLGLALVIFLLAIPTVASALRRS